MMASIMTLKPAVVAYLPMSGPYDQMPGAFGRLYGWIEAHGHKAKGMPTAVYFNIASDPSEADAVWELQTPLDGDVEDAPPGEDGVGVKHVPQMTVVSAVHKGPYDSVTPTYQALWSWIEDSGYETAGPPMERYLNNPGEASSEECLTEIIMPIARP